MKRYIPVLAVVAACALAFLPGAWAQEEAGETSNAFSHLHFVNEGPAVAGGRVAAVVGIPGNPNIYYIGAAGGGVWKTSDGGESWKAVFEHADTASIGAIALAPSDPDLVWVGTGEANIRNDVLDGAGVYFSPDAGHTWKFMGLRDAGQITDIVVDPHDPNTVFIGVFGHAWGPNSDRGVFKTTDGGKTWRKVLYVNDTTGVSDLVMDGNNPRVLFAGMWQARRYPWMLDSGGPGSGLYRSTDGGENWTKLAKGLPEGPLGRIAVAVAPSNPDHVYALIEAKRGLLWQSHDLGDSWTAVSDNHALDVRPFYFSRLFVAPNDENKLYFLSFQLMVSSDGGKTARIADRGVHPDHHALWIDPQNPNRILQGNDGGVWLTVNGGETWKFEDGMPLAEMYMVGVGHDTPYTLCAGLQDNSGWCGNERGGWYTVAGGDGQYAVQAPSDPDIIYADSQNGSISRLDLAHHIRWSIRPYGPGVEQEAPSDLKYRFNWTTPIAVSPTDPNEVYLGANVMFRTMDGGKTWSVISPDLTHNDKSKQATSGGSIDYDISGAETYGTIMSITLAPSDPQVIWVGSDDGMVHVSRDAGKTWTDVTANISGAPEWARVYQIGVSPFDPGAAYASFDAHMIDDTHAYVFRTRDYGKTWQKITDGLPDEPVHVVREDPNHRGLLVAGTDIGLSYSIDDGDHWQKFPVELPTVSVWDIHFIKRLDDLAIATHGRGFFTLDNLRPIEERDSTVASSDFHLFSVPSVTFENFFFGGNQGRRSDLYHVPPAMPGATIDYFLKTAIHGAGRPGMGGPGGPGRGGMMLGGGQMMGGEGGPAGERRGPVKIVITDAAGHTVATNYGPGAAGINQFVWNLRYDEATRLRIAPPPSTGGGGGGFFFRGGGPQVVPGAYKVSVTANGDTQTQTVEVRSDPQLHAVPGAFQAELDYALEGRDMMSTLNEMLNRIADMNRQLSAFEATARPDDNAPAPASLQPVLAAGRTLHGQLNKLEESVYNTHVQRAAPEDDIHFLSDLHGKVQGLMRGGSIGYGEPPSSWAVEEMADLRKQVEDRLDAFDNLLKTDVENYNKTAEKAGAPKVFAGEPIHLEPAPARK